jgi:hypothetical protein
VLKSNPRFFGSDFSVFVVKEKAAAKPPKDRCPLEPAEPCTNSTAESVRSQKPKQKPDPEQRCKTQIDSSLVTTQVAIRGEESGVAKIYAFSFALKYKTPSPLKNFKGGL